MSTRAVNGASGDETRALGAKESGRARTRVQVQKKKKVPYEGGNAEVASPLAKGVLTVTEVPKKNK